MRPPVRVVVAVAGAIEHQRHQAAADQQGEQDAAADREPAPERDGIAEARQVVPANQNEAISSANSGTMSQSDFMAFTIGALTCVCIRKRPAGGRAFRRVDRLIAYLPVGLAGLLMPPGEAMPPEPVVVFDWTWK